MTPLDHNICEKATKNVDSEQRPRHDDNPPAGRWARIRDLLGKAAAFGRVELRGITPIPVQERTVERTINVFTLWWSMNANILP